MKISKITRSTIKKYIKDHKYCLYVKPISSFDGQTDGVIGIHANWTEVNHNDIDFKKEYSYGIPYAWFTPTGNLYEEYEDIDMKGYSIYNCCGAFLLANKKYQ